ncbi:hypothetical protein M408DRAFT_225974 [Serendipita vermifera MAFF 305830]|uniref:Uncharacterized protein n=1 Tax=Serendipita vermifera MAFF 305830 TaxID=933852 RepID=A0A0C3AKA5_SERVB|nr:hypothetical protein M408DRAFT_225974 [Serendipita vermifera MAFF 305830]
MLDIVRMEPLNEEDESRFSGLSTTSMVTTSDRYDWGDEEEREPPCMRLVIATDRNTYMDASTIASTESLSAAGPEASSPGTSVSGLVTQNTTEFIEAPHECIPNPPAPVDNNADEPPPPSDISSRSRASSVSLHEVNLVHGVQVPMATALAHIVNARELLRPTTPLQPPDTPIHTGPPPSPGDQVEELPDLPDAPPQEPDDARVARPSSMHVYAGLGLWASLSVGLVASMI